MLDRKKLYKEALYAEYKNMHQALCKMTSYYEKLTTDGFELNEQDKEYINNILLKVDKKFLKHINGWLERASKKLEE